MNDKWVRTPKLEIKIDRDLHSCFVLESPTRGKLITESRQTALNVINQWFDYQDQILKEISKQEGTAVSFKATA